MKQGPVFNERQVYIEMTLFDSLLNIFADEEEQQVSNISVGEQDFKFMDFARR
jgi:hypothetical protein